MALAATAAALRELPRLALDDVAGQIVAVAEQVGGTVAGQRLTARHQLSGGAGTAVATISGVPTAPWVWINDGTGAHVIGVRGGRRRPALLLAGAPHPVTPPVGHPGATGRGAWRQVARQAQQIAPAVVAGHVHQAVSS